jgi:hypothetical protein
LHGKDDFEVLPSQALKLNKVLKVPNRLKIFPKLNHFLTPSILKSPSLGYEGKARIPNKVVQEISDWIQGSK